MKYIKDNIQSLNKKRLLLLVLIFSLAGYALVVFAVAPSGGYAPGQTLDPDCMPGEIDCLVTISTSSAYAFSSPLIESGGMVSIPKSTSTVDGYLDSSDWNIFNNKENSLGLGTSGQYLRGDKSFATLDTSIVPEVTNLYWTNNRFDTRIAAVTSIPNLQTIGTITSGVWHGSQITDAYISDSITASNYILLSQRGAANGVATLDGTGKIPTSQLSSFSLSDTFVVNSEAEMLNLSAAELGDVAIRLDVNKSYILTTNDPSNLSNWQEIITPLNHVLAVNGQIGAVNLTTTNIPEGLNLYYTDNRVDDYLNTQKGIANGIASLDANGHIPTSQIGSIVLNETFVVPNQAAMFAISGAHNGDLVVITSTNETYVLADENNTTVLSSWIQIVNGVPVSSVNGQTGVVNLTTTNISEGSNQYFTNARARNALTATGPLTYSPTTGIFGISAADTVSNGYLSAVDWNTFNSKQNALTFGTITASNNPEVIITGGTGAVIGGGVDITIPDASTTTRGLVTTDSQNFSGIKTFENNIGIGDSAPSTLFSIGIGGYFQVNASGNIVKINNINYSWPNNQGGNGTVLMNDGSGNLTWQSNGLVSLNGLTEADQSFAIDSNGSDFSISSSNGVHTFSIPTASSINRGLVSSSDWISFSNKPIVDTTYNNIYSLAIGAGPVLNTAGGGQNNILLGYQSGDALTTSYNNVLLGYQAGKGVSTGIDYANFFGTQAGQNASNAEYANFMGRQAGLSATNASFSNFFGQQAGYQASGANTANFIGRQAGYQASGAAFSNFIGASAGSTATNAQHSNFIGRLAGNAAANAAYSNFIGYQSGYGASNAANSIFIGKNSGYADTVNNTVSGSSIAIGDSAGTGGFSNSIALGASAVNTSANQLLIGSSYTKFNVRGIDYTWPAAQSAGSGYALTNNGSGVLSWSPNLAIGGSNGQLQYNNSGALAGVTGVTFDGTNFDAKDNIFRIVNGSDITRRAIFDTSAIDTGTTRTYSFPNTAGTLALTSDFAGYIKNNVGIIGGTTLIGGTASGNNLTLSSTSNATKGKILFGTSAYDEVNNRLGIGTKTPATTLDVQGTLTLGNITLSSAGSGILDIKGNDNFTTSRLWYGANVSMSVMSNGINDNAIGWAVDKAGNTGGSYRSGTTTANTIRSLAGDLIFTADTGLAGGWLNFTATERMRLTTAGLGIGISSPTAKLHLAAGTATAGTAPLKFTSGTNLTTAETGAMEYNGTSLMFTRSGTLRAGLLMTDIASPFNTYSQSAKGATAFTSGTDNILIGNGTGAALTTGVDNIMFGRNSTTGSGNISNIVMGGQANAGGNFNVILGQLAGYSNSNTSNSVAIGYQANRFSVYPDNGIAIGAEAESGFGDSIAIGRYTRASKTGGGFNTFIGSYAGNFDATGIGNTILGNRSGRGLTSGTYNLLLGYSSGINITSGNKNIIIGYNLDAPVASTDGQLSIQNIIFGTGNIGTGTSISTGKIGIGTNTPGYRFSVSDTTTAGIVGSFTNSDGTCTLDPGDVSGWSCPSDLNLKKDITTVEIGSLDQILALRPVNYRLRNEDSSVNLSTGLIAQEVQTIFPKLVKIQLDGTLALNYGGLTPYMISAIQEMNFKITEIGIMEKPNTWRDSLIAWFANTSNGITAFFSKKVSTEELCVKDSGGETCITRSQLNQLLNGQSAQSPSVPPVTNPTPDPTPIDPGDESAPPVDDIVIPVSDPVPPLDQVPPSDSPSDPVPTTDPGI